MSFAVLFSNNPKPQYYNACTAVHAVVIAERLDGKAFGKVIGVSPNLSSYRSV